MQSADPIPDFDPTDPTFLETSGGEEVPPLDYPAAAAPGPTEPDLVRLGLVVPRGAAPPSNGLVFHHATPIIRGPDGHRCLYNRALVLDEERRRQSLCVVGLPGSGKNQCVINPAIISAIRSPGAVIIAEVKNELYPLVAAACAEAGRKPPIYFDPTDAGRSVRHNPLAEETFLAKVLATIAAWPSGERDSPFFARTAKNLLQAGVDLGYKSLPCLLPFVSKPRDRLRAELGKNAGKSAAVDSALAFVHSEQNSNFDTTVAQATSALDCFAAVDIRDVFSGTNELDVRRAVREERAILVTCSEHRLPEARLPLNLLLTELADATISSPPSRTTFIVNDAASWGPLDWLPGVLLTGRSRGIGWILDFQTTAALERALGTNAARAIVENCGAVLVMPTCSADDAERFSKWSGEISFRADSSAPLERRPLFLPSDIRSPKASHFLYGRPATVLLPAASLYCYFWPLYERCPAYRAEQRGLLARQTRAPLRKTSAAPLTLPSPPQPVHPTAAALKPQPERPKSPSRDTPSGDTPSHPSHSRHVFRSGEVCPARLAGFYRVIASSEGSKPLLPPSPQIVHVRPGEIFPALQGHPCRWIRMT